MSTTPGIIIVGAGQGGLQTAISLRQEGFDGLIDLIGGEVGLPYQRPPLSKAYLKDGNVDKIRLRPEAFYESNGINLRDGTWVSKFDPAAKTVSLDGETLSYEKLVLATGSRNLLPPISGIEHCLGMRDLSDATKLRNALTKKRKIAIIGGGFIGLEFAAVSRLAGHEVTIAEAAPRLMARAVSEEVSALFLERHRSLGSAVMLDSLATDVTEAGVTLKDGQVIEADLVLLAAGILPNVELAQQAGLTVRNGIVVNKTLQTSDPSIYALGDCASFPEPTMGTHVRLESVQAATDHARLIAKHISKGEADDYSALPWFWSDQADWKLQIAGLAKQTDSSTKVSDTVIYRFDGEILSAVETINEPRTHMMARRVLASADRPTKRDLEDRDYELIV